MKKDDTIIKLENELYNPQPNVTHIVLKKIYSGVYEYKNYLIQKVDKTIKYRPFDFDWKIYKNQRYIITVPTLQRARQYFNSIGEMKRIKDNNLGIVLRKMKRIKYDKLGRVVKNSENYKGKKIIKSIKNNNIQLD